MAGAGPGADAGAGLAAALHLDATLAGHPARLRRALADLAPHDDRGGHLITLGAELGVPGLLAGGQLAEAHARLADLGGCRADAVAWVVAAWAAGLGLAEPDGPPPADPEPAAAAPVEVPGPATSLHLAVWPDGTPALAILTLDGAFVLADARQPARGGWRRAASPRAPLSRDIALALAAGGGEVVWSDRDGVHARAVARAPAAHAGGLRLGEPRLLAASPPGGQARYPLTALITGPGSLDVIWTADRQALCCAQARDGGPAPAGTPLPPACGSGEQLSGLQAAPESGRTAWLVCVTDRGRVLLARWDTAFGSHEAWQPLDPPARDITAATIAALPGGPMVMAVTAGGNLLSRPAGRDGRWHSVDRPQEIRGAGPVRALSAGAAGESAWLAVVTDSASWVLPLGQRGGQPECGVPVPLWLGG